MDAAAEQGDDIAVGILEEAGHKLVATAGTAAGASTAERGDVAASYTGRVFQSRRVLDSFRRHAGATGLQVQPPEGDGLAGALAMARGHGARLFDGLITVTQQP